jgi:hypothetical protein
MIFLYSQKEKNPNYTVHIGTFTNDDIPTQLKKKAKSDARIGGT